MSDNVLQTLQRLVQDVIAPDVRELKVRLESFEKQTEANFVSIQKQIEANTKAIMSAIAENRAQGELASLSQVIELRERVAVLERSGTRNDVFVRWASLWNW